MRLQNQTGRHPTKWDKTGRVVEVRQHNQYVVRVDGSGRMTLRNRQFLRKYTPVVPSRPQHTRLGELLEDLRRQPPARPPPSLEPRYCNQTGSSPPAPPPGSEDLPCPSSAGAGTRAASCVAAWIPCCAAAGPCITAAAGGGNPAIPRATQTCVTCHAVVAIASRVQSCDPVHSYRAVTYPTACCVSFAAVQERCTRTCTLRYPYTVTKAP